MADVNGSIQGYASNGSNTTDNVNVNVNVNYTVSSTEPSQNRAPGEPVVNRTACRECQRRKQKCNREWPCDACQARRVAHKCRFAPPKTTADKSTPALNKKRSRTFEAEDHTAPLVANDDSDSDDSLDLEAIGYGGSLLSSLVGVHIQKTKAPVQKVDWVTPTSSFPLRQALEILPSRPKMDALVQLFFDNVNYHYYIIYPAVFLSEYQDWWEARTKNKAVTIQWTSLLVMVCACAIQHLDASDKPQIELDFGEPSEVLTERYLNVGRELANSVPPGHYHLLNVQQMLHAIYWYKAEAKFVEAWHLIGAAIRESQELGLSKASASDGLSEFEREMRRRVWCILSTWDWQFASGLGRPTIIDHCDVDVPQPSLTLERLQPSPLLHMKLQAEVVTILAARFGAPKNVQTPAEIQEYLRILETWMKTFPAVYSTENPDYSGDAAHPWAVSHRFYIHTMAYLMILNPIRSYMAKTYSKSTPEEEHRIREIGVYYSIKNLHTTSQWTEHVHHRDGRFHFIIFSLFDTASVLSAAIIKDENYSIPRRDEIIAGIEQAVVLLGRLNAISKTANTSFNILSRMVKRLPRPTRFGNKRFKIGSSPKPPFSRRGPPSGMDGTATEESASHYGSDTASPANSNSYDSATTGSTPQSQQVVTPESVPLDMEPNVQEQPQSAFIPDNSVQYGVYDQSGMALNGMLHPQYQPMTDAQPQLAMGGMVNPLGPYADLQPVAPTVADSYNQMHITDTELGDFSRLWDWGSLNLDFIHSDAAILTAPSGDVPPTTQ